MTFIAKFKHYLRGINDFKPTKIKFFYLLKMYRLKTLSKITGINYHTLTRLSRKSRKVHEIEVRTAYKLAKGLGMTLDEFINKVYEGLNE